jgi:hypothetical protein
VLSTLVSVSTASLMALRFLPSCVRARPQQGRRWASSQSRAMSCSSSPPPIALWAPDGSRHRNVRTGDFVGAAMVALRLAGIIGRRALFWSQPRVHPRIQIDDFVKRKSTSFPKQRASADDGELGKGSVAQRNPERLSYIFRRLRAAQQTQRAEMSASVRERGRGVHSCSSSGNFAAEKA